MWQPNPAVTIDGTDYTGETLNGINFTFGASDFLAGVQPPYGTISLVNVTGSALPIYLSSPVEITVDNHAGTGRVILFSGIISDINVSLEAVDAAFYDLTVVGYSQFFESRVINEVPVIWDLDTSFNQFDYDRFDYLVKAGTGAPIDLLSGTIDAQTGNIEDFPNYLGTVYQSPVSYDRVYQLPLGAAVAGQLIAEFAAGVSGWVWEGRLGTINYRAFDNLSSTSHAVPQGAVYVQALNRSSTLTELYNLINLYNAFNTYTYTDVSSQGDYGVRSLDVVTQYTALSRYPEQGAYLLDYLANNIDQLNGLTIDVTSDDLLGTTRDALLTVDMTDTVNFTVPDDIFDTGTGSGRICGWSWGIQRDRLDLTLNLVKVE